MLIIDHINGIRTDNRLPNLQIVTHRENTSTCFRKNRKTFTSNYVGVHWNPKLNKWVSQIMVNGERKHLGVFISEIEASDAYQKVLKTLTKFKHT